MLNKKRLFAGILVLAIILTGSLAAVQSHSVSETELTEEELTEFTRENWRLQHRLNALNKLYQEKLLNEASEAELRELEDEIFELREELLELEERHYSASQRGRHGMHGMTGGGTTEEYSESDEIFRGHHRGLHGGFGHPFIPCR